jgi:osmotically inducible lipoprotein OsmB
VNYLNARGVYTMSKLKTATAAAMTLVLASGCADMSSTQQRTLSGAAIGTAAGYAVGAMTGMSKGTGMAIGAAAGAASGYIYDKYKEDEGR